MPENMIGAYGEWAAGLVPDPPALSFRRPEFTNLNAWRTRARLRYTEALLQPDSGGVPKPDIQHHISFDGLAIEQMFWQLPYGPPTEALVLKPEGASGRLPAVVGLHDHGGNKYFGLRKITRIGKDPHPLILKHQDQYYGGVAWANELAKRGYVVLVHDAFTFGSRRVRLADVPARIRDNAVETNPESPEEIQRYNNFAGQHEHIMAKSLFSAGTTWPGVFTGEDQRALDYLCSRPDVDTSRVGVCGLSGGGLRTVYLTGLDARVRCSCCVGMMTTWRDYLLNKSVNHTWMVYIPGLPRDLDYPEIFGLNAPYPLMVLNNHEDALFTVPEMQRADAILASVYRKAGYADRYRMNFHPGPHKFDRAMQAEAFAWFDRWLKA
jgi:dienelactone hydrolase